MSLRMLSFAFFGTVVLTSASAFGADDSAEREKKDTFSHAEQFGVRLALALPFKVSFRFDDSPGCGLSDSGEEKKVCPISSPAALDVALTYGITDTIEPFLWWRLGLGNETATNTEAIKVLGVGLRLYTVSASRLKAFLEPSLGAEFEGAITPMPNRNYATDMLIRLHFGGQYDFTRNVGAFVTLGPDASFVRALSLGIEGSLGIQGRFP